jgi:hypothetical protein
MAKNIKINEPMKKSSILFMVIMTFALLSNGCSKEGSSNENEMINITVSAQLPETKAVFEQGTGNSLNVKWKTGTETIGIYAGSNSQTPNVFTANLGVDATTATFAGSIPSGSSTLYAVYPSTTAMDPTAIPFDLSNQTGNGNNLSELAMKLPMVASATVAAPTFTFANKVAILKLVLTLPADAYVKSVSYGGYNVHNTAKLNATVNENPWTYTDEGIGLVSVNYSTSFPAHENTPFTVYLAAFPETSNNVTVLVRTDDNKEYSFNYTTNIATGKAIEAGKVYSMTKTLSLNTGEFNYTGDGTSSHPFLISTSDQLRLLSTRINAATVPYSNSGIYYKQTADIALSGTFTSIGTETNTFKGVYDGNSKSITGLSVNSTVSGLFGCNAGTVKSITVDGTIVGSDKAGGIVGNNSGSVMSCNFKGTVSGSSGSVGGIVGCNTYTVNTVVSYSNMYGNISGSARFVGGIVGTDEGCKITNCSTIKNIDTPNKLYSSASAAYIGGILGRSLTGNVDYGTSVLFCSNNISIESTGTDSYGGGVVGYLLTQNTSKMYSSIEACYNSASISVLGTANSIVSAGGLIGYCSFTIPLSISTTSANLIRGCYNSGDVFCPNGYAGGLIGYVINGGTNSLYSIGVINGVNSVISGSYSISGKLTGAANCFGNYIGYAKNINIFNLIANYKSNTSNVVNSSYAIGKNSPNSNNIVNRTSNVSTLSAANITNLNEGWNSANSARIYQFDASGNIVAK